MKRKSKIIISLLLIAAILSVAGCSDTNEQEINYSEEYVFGQDSQETFSHDMYTSNMAESENSYYFFGSQDTTSTANSFLYVIDKETHTCQPLCSKSDCLHEDELVNTECDACFPYTNSIIYYMDKLYYNTEEHLVDEDGNFYITYEICRMNLDGTNRETVFSSEEYYIWNFKVHRGYIYFQGNVVAEGATQSAESAYYRIALEGDTVGEVEEIIPIYEYYESGMYLGDVRIYGNQLLISFKTGESCVIYKYDLTTDEYTQITGTHFSDSYGWFTIFNGKLVFDNGYKIYECSLDGSDEREVLDFSDSDLKDYLYFQPFTNDGENLIITVASNDEELPTKLVFCDEDYNTSVYQTSYSFSADAGCDSDVLIVYNEENCTLELYDKSTLSEDAVAEPEVLYTFESTASKMYVTE